MIQRNFGDTKIAVSALGVGMWSLVTDWWGEPDKAQEIIKKSMEIGVNFFDTADMYGNGKAEEILGKSLGSNRDKVVILTKIGYDFYTNKFKPKQRYDLEYLRFAVNESLKRLSTDYVDVLMLHNPKLKDISNKELLDFMRSLKSDGLARSVGVALGPTLGWEEEGLKAIEMGYEGLEHIFNLIEQYPARKFLQFNVGHVVRVPHASDVLNDLKWPLKEDPKLHRHFKSMDWISRAVERSIELKKYAEKRGMKLRDLAIAFILSHRTVSSVIPNITNLKELEEFSKASDLTLDESDLEFLENYYNTNYKDLNEESIRETLIYK
ncbi:aldo/keto reductase [Metallosphaera tengchongensis]|uniref:Aldo/keto reductase n=1 Tax=Metallosphaera tengchongensis TaxID=1532350 RepID=A0A6N0NVC4_9CREN|nr:aldo/keto reductase [Metallosphaera tengchongensis]QKQ99792.1 aldo/keto reductase [Metallosphaera tengchongensis]